MSFDRPRQLQARVVPVTGYGVGPGREAHEHDQRCVEFTLRMSDLLLDSQSQIAEPRSQSREGIIRNRKPQLGRIRQAETPLSYRDRRRCADRKRW